MKDLDGDGQTLLVLRAATLFSESKADDALTLLGQLSEDYVTSELPRRMKSDTLVFDAALAVADTLFDLKGQADEAKQQALEEAVWMHRIATD